MLYSSSITTKGQATIPLVIRQHLRLAKGDKIVFSLIDDQVVLTGVNSFLDLAGSVKTKRKYSDHDWDKTIKSYVKKHGEFP